MKTIIPPKSFINHKAYCTIWKYNCNLLFFIILFISPNIYAQKYTITLDDLSAPMSANSIIFSKNEILYQFQKKHSMTMTYFLTYDYKDSNDDLYNNYEFAQLNAMFSSFININDYFSIPLFVSVAADMTIDDNPDNFMHGNLYAGTGFFISHKKIGSLGILGGYYGEPETRNGEKITQEEKNMFAATLVPTVEFGSIPGIGLVLKHLNNFFYVNFLPENLKDYEFNRSHKLISQNLRIGNIMSLDYLYLINGDEPFDAHSRSKYNGIGLRVSFNLQDGQDNAFSILTNFGYREFYNVTSQSAINKNSYEDTYFGKIALGIAKDDEGESLLGISMELSKKYYPVPKFALFYLSDNLLISFEGCFIKTDISSNLEFGLSLRWNIGMFTGY